MTSRVPRGESRLESPCGRAGLGLAEGPAVGVGGGGTNSWLSAPVGSGWPGTAGYSAPAPARAPEADLRPAEVREGLSACC